MAQKRKGWNGLISGFKASDLVFLDESGCNTDMTRRSPGCGSQRLLRCRLHPAGRGPNSSSLFPPLAAVVAVASGLTDGSRAVSTKKEDPLSELQLREGVFFLVSQMTSSISTFTIFSICNSPQKSSAAQKVYRAGLAAKGRPVLVQPLSLTSFASSPSRGASGEEAKLYGMPKPPLARGGGIASAMTERLYYRQLHRA